ncbi:MAG TPA: PDZ domain-containing protein, partial [Longimicrobiales bacterium]|nr:PDZ domain-containing protein [Longimicrobiales bacterium]
MIALLLTALVGISPRIHYTLHAETTQLNVVTVLIRIADAPDSVILAAAAHPEYDDKYWRYIEDMHSNTSMRRLDSVRWVVKTNNGDVAIQYRVRFPQQPGARGSWRPFLSATGGLVGGPHSFLYLLGFENAPVSVTLQLPDGWKVATGLTTNDDRAFIAPNADALIDSPIFVGLFSDWRFEVQGVPHRIAYWRAPRPAQLDTIAFRNNLERYVRAAVGFWGMMPYKSYTFLYQDEAYGGLEHKNSVTLSPTYLEETAHEYFHTWNLMHIMPVEYRGVDYRMQPPVAGLWFSEGLTLYYADLLLRRAGLETEYPTRIAHIEHMLERYYESPGNTRFSAEEVSRKAYNAGPEAFGDYDASTHLQGEVIGNALDFRIRSATNGRRSVDDLMRAMLKTPRFTSRDVERAAAKVCACDVSDIFRTAVYNGAPLNFNRYLNMIGLRMTVQRIQAKTTDSVADSTLAADNRIYAWQPQANAPLRLRIWYPDGVWARAGLHTGDEIVTFNGKAVSSWPAFRAIVGGMKIGDTARVVVNRKGVQSETTVRMTGYERPVVHVD